MLPLPDAPCVILTSLVRIAIEPFTPATPPPIPQALTFPVELTVVTVISTGTAYAKVFSGTVTDEPAGVTLNLVSAFLTL